MELNFESRLAMCQHEHKATETRARHETGKVLEIHDQAVESVQYLERNLTQVR